MKTDAQKVAEGLSEAQRRMVMLSVPGGWGSPSEACGTQVAGPGYRTAKALAALGLGTYSHGSPYGDLYFNSEFGLEVRAILQEKAGG